MAKESTGQSASRKQLIIIGALAVVLLAVVYFLFLKGDGTEPVDDAAPAPAPVTESAPVEEEEKTPAPTKKGKGAIETSEVFGGKDPFEPVVDLIGGDGGGEATTTTTEVTTDQGTTDTTTDTGSTTPTTPTTPIAPIAPIVPTPPPSDDVDDDDDDSDDDDEPLTGLSVRLLKVYEEDGESMALVETKNRVNNKKRLHELKVGQQFRENFELTSLDEECGTFLYGDEPFGLCEGQRVIRK